MEVKLKLFSVAQSLLKGKRGTRRAWPQARWATFPEQAAWEVGCDPGQPHARGCWSCRSCSEPAPAPTTDPTPWAGHEQPAAHARDAAEHGELSKAAGSGGHGSATTALPPHSSTKKSATRKDFLPVTIIDSPWISTLR